MGIKIRVRVAGEDGTQRIEVPEVCTLAQLRKAVSTKCMSDACEPTAVAITLNRADDVGAHGAVGEAATLRACGIARGDIIHVFQVRVVRAFSRSALSHESGVRTQCRNAIFFSSFFLQPRTGQHPPTPNPKTDTTPPPGSSRRSGRAVPLPRRPPRPRRRLRRRRRGVPLPHRRSTSQNPPPPAREEEVRMLQPPRRRRRRQWRPR
jgi:hypothetical protein